MGIAATPAMGIVFTDGPGLATSDAPRTMLAADFNGDGDTDLAVTNQSASGTPRPDLQIFTGATGATFTAPAGYTTAQAAFGLALGEFDGNTDPDLVVANYNGSNVSVLLGGSGSSFSSAANFPAGSGPTDVAIGDFNGDGDPDLAVSDTFAPDQIAILLGEAGATFGAPTAITGLEPTRLATGDFNGDGDPDIVYTDTDGTGHGLHLLTGTGASAATFSASTHIAAVSNPGKPVVGEFNGDNDPDIAIPGSQDDNVAVLLGTGASAATFSSPTTYPAGDFPQFVVARDLDGDGDPDLVTANSYSDSISVLPGSTGGTFAAKQDLTVGDYPLAVAAGDFNGDGAPDLAALNSSAGTVSIKLQVPPPAAPTGLATTPSVSPAAQQSIRVSGTAPAGTTVQVHDTSDCTGTPVATGSAADFASPGLAYTMPSYSSKTFRATATDSDSQTSACSTGSVTYTHDPNAASAPTAITQAGAGQGSYEAILAGAVSPRGAATEWWFEYGPSTAYGQSTPRTPLGATAPMQGVSTRVSGLTAATTYHLRFVARNELGTTYGDDVTFTTWPVQAGGSGPVYGTPPPGPFLEAPAFFPPSPGTGEATASGGASELARALATRGARLARILRAGGYRAPFTAPSAGTASIRWRAAGAVVAAGKKSIGAAGATTIFVRLSKKGKAVLGKAKRARKRLQVKASGTFAPASRPPVSGTRSFTLLP